MSDGSVFDRAPAFVVHVEDTISPALAGHDGCTYQSPPQPRDEALSLIRILLGRSEEPPADERGPGPARSPAASARSRSSRFPSPGN